MNVSDKVRTTREFYERYGFSLSGVINMIHISEKNRLGRSHRITLDEPFRHRPDFHEFKQVWLDPQYLEVVK